MQLAVKIILILVIVGIVSTGVTFGVLGVYDHLKKSDEHKPTSSKSSSLAPRMKDDNVKDDAVKDDAVKDDNVKDDAVKDDAVKDDAVKDDMVEEIIPKLISGSYYTGPLAGKTQQVLCGKIWNNIDVNYDLPVDQNLGPVSPEQRAD